VRLTHSTRLAQCITYIEGLPDAELAWLYQNCQFTVFPSLYEGWGLPITESLDFGRPCLTGSGSSVEEAGEGMSVVLDPRDRLEWKSKILELWNDPDLLSSMSANIRHNHRIISPRVTADSILAVTTKV
jgi:glycosyltransferase involved in cell wall biosynthesis